MSTRGLSLPALAMVLFGTWSVIAACSSGELDDESDGGRGVVISCQEMLRKRCADDVEGSPDQLVECERTKAGPCGAEFDALVACTFKDATCSESGGLGITLINPSTVCLPETDAYAICARANPLPEAGPDAADAAIVDAPLRHDVAPPPEEDAAVSD